MWTYDKIELTSRIIYSGIMPNDLNESSKRSSTSSQDSSDETQVEEIDATTATKRKRSFEKTITKKIDALAGVLQSSAKKQKGT